jgi:hypothetical protein
MARFRSPEAEALASRMAVAERVKFGRLRTGSEAVQSHLLALHAWIAERGEARR